MTTVLYTSPFVPPEWIAAHGLTPQRIVPATAIHALPPLEALVETIKERRKR